MKLLALDTSGENCSCALVLGSAVHARCERVPRGHAERLLPMVEELLAQAQVGLRSLDGLAFGRGPGSFTGLRIAAGVVQGLARGAELPVAPVSSLQALAQGALRRLGYTRVLTLFDARMGEVYAGAFYRDAAGLMQPVWEERVCGPLDVPALPAQTGAAQRADWRGAGGGWTAYSQELESRFGMRAPTEAAALAPEAEDVAALGAVMLERGEGVEAASAVPVYLRNRVAATRSEREAGRKRGAG